ncbi:hypothetical protein K438DRAFT_1973613 [Mycena galopus ATCC 62051]|nr:hypothetical protein K438DRAFT_1973613 [Mycena galopus ATCC 62051]
MYPEVKGFPDQTQLYSGRRLLSSQGYAYPPLIDDTFTLWLPEPGTNFGREVRTSSDGHTQRFELGSPNSVQLPYYPGVQSSVLDLQLSDSLEQQRDVRGEESSLRRPQFTAFDLSTRAEYVPIIRVWEVSDEKPFTGHLRAEFVKDLEEASCSAQTRMMGVGMRIYRERVELRNLRLTRPLQREFDNLRTITSFERALDLGWELQRVMQEKFAWARIAEAWLQYDGKEAELASVEILPANEEFIRVWIHGIDVAELRFFLGSARVPCFLIHELSELDPPGELVMGDFVQGTPLADSLDPQNSEFDRIALLLNSGERTPHDGSLPLPGVAMNAPADRVFSGRGVSIPESDKDGEEPPEATVQTGSEWAAAPRAMISRTEVTVPSIHSVNVTQFLLDSASSALGQSLFSPLSSVIASSHVAARSSQPPLLHTPVVPSLSTREFTSSLFSSTLLITSGATIPVLFPASSTVQVLH